MRRYGPYEPLEVLVKQKNAIIYRARGPRGYAALVVYEPGAKARAREEVVFTVWASADPPYYAFEVLKGPTEEEPLQRALFRLDRTSEFMYKLSALEFLRARPEGMHERLWREAKSSFKRLVSLTSEGAVSAARAVRRAGHAVSATVSSAVPAVGRAMPAAGTLAAVIASIAVIVTMTRTPLGEVPRVGATSAERTDEGGLVPDRLNRAHDEAAVTFARPMPAQPFRWQLLVPCRFAGEPAKHPEYSKRVAIHGGCWREVKGKPPCGWDYEYEGSCYTPIHKDPLPDDPTAVKPE